MPPAITMRSRLSDLDQWWLEVQCCGTVTLVPFRMLARQHRPTDRLNAILPRLRCERCRDRPARVAIVETPTRRQGDPEDAWRLPLPIA